MANEPSKFVWYELLTTDPQAAETFYSKVVGWQMADSGLPGPKYTIISMGSAMVGGLMAIPEEAEGMPPVWMGYIGVADLEAALARLQAAGGKVHRAPQEIPGVGRFAVVADPQGATFILFTSMAGQTPPPDQMGQPGRVGWHELYANDGATAFEFYADQFGWTKSDTMDMGPMGQYLIFAIGGAPAGGIMTKPAQIPMPFWGFYFNVPALDAASSTVTANGGKVINGPTQVPGGSWIVQCIDPQGAMFSLVAPQR